MLKQRTELKRSTPLKQGGQLARASAPMKRSEMARNTPMAQGAAKLARTGTMVRTPMARAVQVKPAQLPALARKASRTFEPAQPARPRKRMKSSRVKMTPIRASARDEVCTLRLPGICNCRTDTTVLCHRNGAGAGMKAADTDAAYGCYACHTVLDGQAPRPPWLGREAMLEIFELAVRRTHARLIEKGLLTAQESMELLSKGK